MSVFLMGVHDPVTDKFYTVTKCGNGLDDETLAKVNKELQVVKISKNMGKVPSWLKINKSQVPDFVVQDPRVSFLEQREGGMGGRGVKRRN